MSRPTAVIFDNDGLLLDTESVWTRGEEVLFERRGRTFTLEHKRELVGTSAAISGGILARQLDEPGADAALIAELDAIVLDELERGIEPMAGALELVGRLRAERVPIAVVSNSPARFIGRTLELAGIAGAFAAVVSGHEVPAPKPAPDPYLEACAQLGLDPGREVLVLEDSPTGVRSALAAGLTVIGVPSLDGIELTEAHEVYGSLGDVGLLATLGLD